MSSPKHHVPANDAPAGEWEEWLRGLGYLRVTEDKPVSNYYAFHGFWVPPRVGPGPEKVVKAPPKKRVPKATPVEDPNSDRARLEAQRARMTFSVEAGMMNEETATQQLRSWARAEGIDPGLV